MSGETPRDTSDLLFPRAKWNTAQVKLVSLSMSQVTKLSKANKLRRWDEKDIEYSIDKK